MRDNNDTLTKLKLEKVGQEGPLGQDELFNYLEKYPWLLYSSVL